MTKIVNTLKDMSAEEAIIGLILVGLLWCIIEIMRIGWRD